MTGIIDSPRIKGTVEVILTGPDGEVKFHSITENLVTVIGNEYYADRAAAIADPPPQVTGMKLGTGDEPVTKTGAGAALETYLADSHQAIAATFPQASMNANARRISWRATWAPGKATSVNPITEAVIVNDALADATSPAASTIARVLIAAPAKTALDSLTINWHHDLGG